MSADDNTKTRVLYEADSSDLSAQTVISRSIPLGCTLWLIWPLAGIPSYFFFKNTLGWHSLVAVIASLDIVSFLIFLIGYFAFMLTFFRFLQALRDDAVLYLMLAGAFLGAIYSGSVIHEYLSESKLIELMPYQLQIFIAYFEAVVFGAILTGGLYKLLQAIIRFFSTSDS